MNTTTNNRRAGIKFALVAATLIAGATAATFPSQPANASSDIWLELVNGYRAMSGLDPIIERSDWSAQAAAHSCYMLENGVTHDETPGLPGYTEGGDIAGNNSNVAVAPLTAAGAREHIDGWMTGPFHAIGIMRHNLTQSGFGLCVEQTSSITWKSGGTLDVLRGIDPDIPRPTDPIVFPGRGATIHLDRFYAETPNPKTMCGWTGDAGLPLFTMMPAAVSTATSTLTGPNGPIHTCTLHAGNVTDPGAKATLAGDNAVIVMPRTHLANGTYTATVNTNGGNVSWSFAVNTAVKFGPPSTPDTTPRSQNSLFEPVTPYRLVDTREGLGAFRLESKQTTTINVGASNITAVSVNITAVNSAGGGYLTAYDCNSAVPPVSTLNFRPGRAVANHAIVPMYSGSMCIYTHADTDLVIDVNGYYRESGPTDGFVPITPARLLDTRQPGRIKLAPGRDIVVPVIGAVPASASSVALNVTVDNSEGAGWAKVYPCGSRAATDTISSINFVTDDVRANSAVVPVGAGGSVCFASNVATDLIVDITGYFTDRGGLRYTTLSPIRLFDSREPWTNINPYTGGKKVAAKRTLRMQIAGFRGIPADAKAVSVNVTLVDPTSSTFATVWPCGPLPPTSNINLQPEHDVAANGALVDLSDTGELCVYTNQETNIIVDINGVWR